MGFCRGGFYCFDCDVSDDGRQLGGAFGALVCFATGKGGDRMTPAWIYRVFQVQLCFIIFQRFMESGVGCMAERDGHALCAGVDGFIVACGFSLITQYPVANAILTHGVMLFELTVFRF